MPKVSKRQLLRDVAVMQRLLDGFNAHADELPDPIVVDGRPMSHRELREQLTASIEELLAMQQAIDHAQAKLERAIEARSDGARKLRAELGEEILAQLGFGNPAGEAERHTRKVRRKSRR